MNLDTVPTSIWRVTVSNQRGLSRVFTTRDEVRTYRRVLRTQGYSTAQLGTTRFVVSPLAEATP